MKRVLYGVCLALIGATVFLHAQTNPLTLNAQQMKSITGTWQGELDFAKGAPMRMVFLIAEENANLSAKVHVSNQGPPVLVVNPINRSGQTLNFEIKKLNGRFTGTIMGDHIKGTFTQSGTDIPLTLTRTARPIAKPTLN